MSISKAEIDRISEIHIQYEISEAQLLDYMAARKKKNTNRKPFFAFVQDTFAKDRVISRSQMRDHLLCPKDNDSANVYINRALKQVKESLGVELSKEGDKQSGHRWVETIDINKHLTDFINAIDTTTNPGVNIKKWCSLKDIPLPLLKTSAKADSRIEEDETNIWSRVGA